MPENKQCLQHCLVVERRTASPMRLHALFLILPFVAESTRQTVALVFRDGVKVMDVISGQWSVVYHVCSASTSFFILCCFTALERIKDDVSGSNPISSRLVLRIQRGVLPFQHLVISQCLGKLFGSCHADGTLSRQPAFASVILWVPVEAIFLRSYGVDWEGLCSQEFSSYIYASGTAVYVCTPVVR